MTKTEKCDLASQLQKTDQFKSYVRASLANTVDYVTDDLAENIADNNDRSTGLSMEIPNEKLINMINSGSYNRCSAGILKPRDTATSVAEATVRNSGISRDSAASRASASSQSLKFFFRIPLVVKKFSSKQHFWS